MTYDNEQADKLVSFATPEEQHALLHNNAGSLHQLWKIPYRQAKEIISNCSTCRSLHVRPIAQGINPRGLQPNELWQMDVTHCPELSPFSFLHVCIDTNSSFIWAIPLHSEATQHIIPYLYFLDTLNNFYNLFLLYILQVFLIIHRHNIQSNKHITH